MRKKETKSIITTGDGLQFKTGKSDNIMFDHHEDLLSWTQKMKKRFLIVDNFNWPDLRRNGQWRLFIPYLSREHLNYGSWTHEVK